MKTSAPRTFSLIWTKTSPSEKRVTSASPERDPEVLARSPRRAAVVRVPREQLQLVRHGSCHSFTGPAWPGPRLIWMVGAGGFEPPNTGSKVPRLTTWPRPRSSRLSVAGCRIAPGRRAAANRQDRAGDRARDPEPPRLRPQRVPDPQRRPVRRGDAEHGRPAARHQRGQAARRPRSAALISVSPGQSRAAARSSPFATAAATAAVPRAERRHQRVDPTPVAVVRRARAGAYTSRVASGKPGFASTSDRSVLACSGRSSSPRPDASAGLRPRKKGTSMPSVTARASSRRAPSRRRPRDSEPREDGRRVRGASAKPRCHRNPLLDPNAYPSGRTRLPADELSGSPCEIVGRPRDIGGRTLEGDAVAARLEGHPVCQFDGPHDGAELVVAIGAAAEHLQPEVDLGSRPDLHPSTGERGKR